MRDTPSRENAIFSFSIPVDPLRRRLFSLVQKPLERGLRLHQLNRIYLQIISEPGRAKRFADSALEGLNISYEAGGSGLASIPAAGPVMVVANHPFGGVDGLILASALQAVRPDVKIMANYLLSRIPELGDVLLSVDPFEGKESFVRNITPLRKGMDWLKKGHMLAIFPAGSVSSLNLQDHRIADPHWNSTVARIVRKAKAPVLPMFFEGANSAFFQAASLVHPAFRMALLPHELLRKRNRRIRLKVGTVLPFKTLDMFDTDEKLMTYLRMRTYALRDEPSRRPGARGKTIPFKKPAQPTLQVIVPAPRLNVLESEVDRLPAGQLLLRMGEYRVFHAAAHQIPNLLTEIGRLREITFRETDEGTGKETDLDRFDAHYTHLFVWNQEKRHVVGAYRLGLVDTVLKRYGKNGLYTSTLFDFKSRFLERVECGIELGRSFVRKEYQRFYAPLLLLWRGIAHFVARNPQYTVLFGPVSISRAYSDLSRQLMMAYLRINHYEPDLARFIKGRTRMRRRGLRMGVECKDVVPADMENLSTLISEIEADRKGVPVLLKHYVKLGGKLMGFNIDPAFGNTLDGLIMVDLLKCDKRILERYMGPEGAAHFFCYHLDVLPEDLAS